MHRAFLRRFFTRSEDGPSMKNKLSVALSVLVCAVLILAALGIGAVKGWKQERTDVTGALQSGGELYSLRQTRAMDALNLLAVAERHLPADDSDLTSLREAAEVLRSAETDPLRLQEADEVISAVTERFADRLPAIESVKARKRDADYVAALSASLSRDKGLSVRYARSAEDFNSRLSSSLMGKLAQLLGVDPLPVGQP